MLDVQKACQEQRELFIRSNSEILDIFWEVFPEPDKTSVDDLIELRKLVAKTEEAHEIAMGYFNIRKLIAMRPPLMG